MRTIFVITLIHFYSKIYTVNIFLVLIITLQLILKIIEFINVIKNQVINLINKSY